MLKLKWVRRWVVSCCALIAGGVATLGRPAPSAGALAVLTGGSGYSADLSAKKAIRKQQLICDPTFAQQGSTSTNYDPSTVSINAVFNMNGYDIDEANSYVGVSATGMPTTPPTNGSTAVPPANTILVRLGDFFDPNPTSPYVETGYVQIAWIADSDAFGNAGEVYGYDSTVDLTGYNVLQHAGVTGDNTNGFLFTYNAGVPDSTVAHYTNYAAPGGLPLQDGGFSQADTLYDNSDTLVPGPYTPATVSGPLPEPTSLALLVFPGLALLAGRRRMRGR